MLLGLLAVASCAHFGGPRAELLQNTPLLFRERWVRGSLSYEPGAANAVTQPLPLTVSLAVGSGTVVKEELGIGPMSNTPCYQVRLLYRPQPNAPSRVIVPAFSHLPGIWSEAPVFCVYVGTEWSWRLILQPSTSPPPPDVNGRLVVSARGPRSATEQFSVIVTRRPNTDDELDDFDENFEGFVVARSEWVSLNAR